MYCVKYSLKKKKEKKPGKPLYKYDISLVIDCFKLLQIFCRFYWTNDICICASILIFFVGVKGLYELVQTACGREVGSLLMFRTWLKDLAKKISMGSGKIPIPLVLKTV